MLTFSYADVNSYLLICKKYRLSVLDNSGNINSVFLFVLIKIRNMAKNSIFLIKLQGIKDDKIIKKSF